MNISITGAGIGAISLLSGAPKEVGLLVYAISTFGGCFPPPARLRTSKRHKLLL